LDELEDDEEEFSDDAGTGIEGVPDSGIGRRSRMFKKDPTLLTVARHNSDKYQLDPSDCI
jgi:hypothetical protein